MNDKFYVVYSSDNIWIDEDWCDTVYELEEKYFTSAEKAEEYMECLEHVNAGCYYVKEVVCGDDFDCKPIIEEYERKQKEEELRDAKRSRLQNVDSYALYKSRIDGSNYGENLKKFKEEYADYIENGAEWSEW